MNLQMSEQRQLSPLDTPSVGRILLVDTDLQDLATYSDMLRSMGHEVISSSSYERATSHLLEENLDVVIVDQGGPYFRGREILERLHASGSRIQVLVLARHHEMRCYLTSLNLGAADYFEKPVTHKDLETAVRACLLTNRVRDISRNGPTLGELSH
jgi:two-component system OmpR family response regulator